MQISSSLKSLKKRHKNCQIIKRGKKLIKQIQDSRHVKDKTDFNLFIVLYKC